MDQTIEYWRKENPTREAHLFMKQGLGFYEKQLIDLGARKQIR